MPRGFSREIAPLRTRTSRDGAVPDAGPPANPPFLPPTTMAAVPPPPISGGTLVVAYYRNIAVAADPDRDLVYGVDLTAGKLLYTVTLRPGDEPGRVVEDPAREIVHVALRGGGALLTIDEKTGAVLARRNVCPAPRGVAWDWGSDRVWVACATGELVAFPSTGGPAVQRWVIERDLRDVLIDADDGLLVTKFRSAEILRIGPDGTITSRFTPQAFLGTSTHVMWRAVTTTDGLIVAVHQAESLSLIQTQQQGGYGGGCGQDVFATTGPCLPPPPGSFEGDAGTTDDAGKPPPPPVFNDAGAGCPPPIVTAQYTVMDTAGNTKFAAEFAGVLPVDIALSRDERTAAIAAPGNAYTESLSAYFTAAVPTVGPYQPFDGNITGQGPLFDSQDINEQPIAVAFDATGDVVLQSREPASLWLPPSSSRAASTRRRAPERHGSCDAPRGSTEASRSDRSLA